MYKTSMPDEDVQSILSGLSSLDDTDEFGRKLLQHERDAQRINSLLGSQGQAFRRARPNPRLALTLANLDHNETLRNGPSQSEGAGLDRAPSVASSEASDPPLNIPRGWGRKGRNSPGWLRRIRQDANGESHVDQLAQKPDASPHIDWLALANNETPASQRRQRYTSASPSVRHDMSLPNNTKEWGSDQDFTADSLLASTPALPSRNSGAAAIEEIMRREGEEGQIRTKPASLRGAWERTPSETRRARTEETSEQEPNPHSTSSPNTRTSLRTFPRRTSRAGNKENVPFNARNTDQSSLLHKSAESLAAVDQEIQAVAPRSPQRPQSRRSDSMALLKSLARASSNSPSPTLAKQRDALGRTGEGRAQASSSRENDEVQPLSAASTNTNYIAPGSLPPRNSPPAATSKASHNDHHTTHDAKPQEAGQSAGTAGALLDTSELPIETPRAVGAWIDTPRTEAPSRQLTVRDFANMPSVPSDEPGAQTLRTSSAPNLPTSALAAVLQNMRNGNHDNQDDPTLGESTIASLEDIMHPRGEDPTVTLDIPDSVLDDSSSIDLHPTTQADRDRRQEALALEAMEKHLETTQSHMHETSLGLRKLEGQIDKSSRTRSLSPPKSSRFDKTKSATASSSSHDHDHDHPADGLCTACGRHTSIFRSLWREYCALFIRRSPTTSPSPSLRSRILTLGPLGRRLHLRLTYLGLLTLLFWSWFLTEATLCDIYCHPLYARTMQGYGVNPDAPEFPYVIPTLVFRPLRPVWRPVGEAVAAAAGKAVWGREKGARRERRPRRGSAYADSDEVWTVPLRRRSSPVGGGGGGGGSGGGAAADVKWFKSKGVGEGGGAEWPRGKMERMNVWDGGARAWEAEAEAGRPGFLDGEEVGSMMDDEAV